MNQSTTAATVLVVDDNEALLELLDVILCTAGYRVFTAKNGADALRLARRIPNIDLLLSDLDMPGMRGDELATRFSHYHPQTPILFVSSSDGPIESTQPFEFLSKPFSITDLRARVRSALQMPMGSARVSQVA